MVEELREAFEQVEQLPDDIQRHIAALIRQEVERVRRPQPASGTERRSYAGAWSDLPEHDEFEVLDRQRHSTSPSPSVAEQLRWLGDV